MASLTHHTRRAPIAVVTLLLALLVGLGWQLARAQQSVPIISAYTLYHPRFVSGSTIAIHNQGTSSATVSIAPAGGSATTATIPALGTITRTGADLGLAASFSSSVVVSADQPVQSLVQLQLPSSTDTLAAYEGIGADSANTSGSFGAIYKNTSQNTAIHLLNIGANAANVSIAFRNLDGSGAQTASFIVPPGGTYTVETGQFSGLPNGYVGWAVYTADQPLVGVLQYSGTTNEYRPQLSAGTGSQYLASALRSTNAELASALAIVNPGASAAIATLIYRDNSGTPVSTATLNLAAFGASVVNLSTLSVPPSTIGVSVQMSSTVPLALGELTRFNGATYHDTRVPQTSISVPYLLKNATYNAGFALHNTGASLANTTVSFYDTAGMLAFSQVLTLPANGTSSFELSTISQLSAGFEGSAVVSSDQPLVVQAKILYSPAPAPTATFGPSPTVKPPEPTATFGPSPTVKPPEPTATPHVEKPTATVAPSPTSGGTTPLLYVNYKAGAPGSKFVVGGYHLVANTVYKVSVNGIAVGSATTDASGKFELLLSTTPTAAEGAYVVAVVVQTARTRQAETPPRAALGSYQLTTSGPDAVVRVAPPNAPPSIAVPATIPALTSAPNVALPVVAR